MARKFGWSLAYIDELSVADLFEYWQIQDGINKAESDVAARARARMERQQRRR